VFSFGLVLDESILGRYGARAIGSGLRIFDAGDYVAGPVSGYV
jgi:hypothetical protein